MYLNDKTNRITLRLNDNQFQFVKLNSDTLGVSPSEFLRMVINATMTLTNNTIDVLQEGIGRENDKANFNNIV